jgi:UDP-glucose 4-epimerase
MGMSKAIMEKLIVAKSKQADNSETIICCTRYGNVMASRGSVIPVFVNQILNDNPITITNSNMTRFMMHLEEAIDLVIFAFQNGLNGDIFIQKSPAATISTLTEALKIIFNKPNHKIQNIGTRHGEKLYEVLLSSEEMSKARDLGKYFCIPADMRDLNYSKYIDQGNVNVSNLEDYNSHNTKRLDVEEMVALLKNLDLIKKIFNKI